MKPLLSRLLVLTAIGGIAVTLGALELACDARRSEPAPSKTRTRSGEMKGESRRPPDAQEDHRVPDDRGKQGNKGNQGNQAKSDIRGALVQPDGGLENGRGGPREESTGRTEEEREPTTAAPLRKGPQEDDEPSPPSPPRDEVRYKVDRVSIVSAADRDKNLGITVDASTVPPQTGAGAVERTPPPSRRIGAGRPGGAADPFEW